MKYLEIQTRNLNPNFTIVLPGACQANCDFCFWKRSENEEHFLKSLKRVLKKLPPNFNQISLSGGEPTLSPVFKDTLKLILKFKKKGKFSKVVLTTNGVNLLKYDLTGIDHVNISRHHYHDRINKDIFKTENVPIYKDLYIINEYINSFGIDVNYNVVVTNENKDLLINRFVEFVKKTGASSLTFRNQYGIFDKSDIEKKLINSGIKAGSVSSCPVCITNTYYIKGVKVKFHSSAYEPTESKAFDLNEVYELILQPNGDLTRDWESKKIILKRKG
jgi:MoaA/NifB/PqqE/SkfB family radical SAM enzyme